MYRRIETLTGWGLTCPSTAEVAVLAPGEPPDAALAELSARGLIARGLGRSYGDAAQNGGGTILRTAGGMELDVHSGVLRAGAGASLDEILRVVVPQGWFVPVTPGTRYVTVGGAIAADIHGKNHHIDGTFGAHVLSLELLTADGQVRTLTPDDTDSGRLFWATVGGMGLTGVILTATIKLIPIESSRMAVDTVRTGDLDELMARMVAADATAHYSVAWVDSVARGRSFGRGVLTTGDHAAVDTLPAAMLDDPLGYDPSVVAGAPPWVPEGLLNRATVRGFNELWFRKAPKHREGEIQSIAGFFHPLDGVRSWNRIYGKGGFLQYQFAVPDAAGGLIGYALGELQRVGAPSFLTVLKRFGPQNPGLLSFPTSGWTLALDVATGLPGLAQTLDRLDEKVIAAGGRLYLAKDSRASAEIIAAGYPHLDEFRAIKSAVDPQGIFRSDLSRRLQL